MSAQVKKAGRIGTKIVATFLFLFLVMFNVQIGMHDGQSSDINLFGLKISVFVPNAIASWYWKLSIYGHPDCDGYVARCGLPGNECSSVVNPDCYPWP